MTNINNVSQPNFVFLTSHINPLRLPQNDDRRFFVVKEAGATGRSAPSVELSDSFIDYHLNVILMASGSALRHYSMHKTKQDMRAAVRATIIASVNNRKEEVKA